MSHNVDFNYLAALIVDAEHGVVEKKLAEVRPSEFASLRNVLGQSLAFCAISVDRAKVLDLLLRRGLSLRDKDANGRGLLHWATKSSALSCMKYLLAHEHPSHVVFEQDKFGVTPLHLAAVHKKAKIFKMLMNELFAKPHLSQSDIQNLHLKLGRVRDKYNRSPLHYAAQNGSTEVIEEILESRLFADDQKDAMGQTAIMYATGAPFATDAVRLLALKSGHIMGMRNNLGQSPVHLAVLANNMEALRIFLDVLPTVPNNLFDTKKRTPLHYAAAMGRIEAAELLIQHNCKNDTKDQYGASPAHYAAQSCVKTLEAILKASKTVDLKDRRNRCCFMWAVLAQNEQAVLWMLANKATEIDRRAWDEYLSTALHLAAQVGNLSIAKILVQQGWSLSDRDQDGATPSHLAAGAGHTELIRYFQTALADKNEVDNFDRTPLFYACAAGQTATVKVMIDDLNFSVNVVDRLGQTPLHYAAFSGNAACARTITEHKNCEISVPDNNGQTPLHLACLRGKRDVVRVLVQKGANINARTAENKTPVVMADGNHRNSIVAILREAEFSQDL